MNPQARIIYARLNALGIPYERHTHPPIPTAADRLAMGLTFDAQACKNLLLTTRSQSRFLLLTLPAGKEADLKALRAAAGSTRLGFADDRALAGLLRQERGTVGPLGVVFDHARRVEVFFDSALGGLTRVALHPGDNTETVVVAFDQLTRYVQGWGSPVACCAL